MHGDLIQQQHGLSIDLSVERVGEDVHELRLGGTGENQQRWQHLINRSAAQRLWAQLTKLLYPRKAPTVTSRVATAPLNKNAFGRRGVTVHVKVVETDGAYTLVGRADRLRWIVEVSEEEARKLWAMLDTVLYPVGWEGRTTTPRQPSVK